MDSIAARLLRFSGIAGPSVGANSLVPPSSVTPQGKALIDAEFQKAGQVADPNAWASYAGYMRRAVTFEAQLQQWEEMAGWDLIAAALTEIVDEATQTDATSPGTLWYECNDRKFEEELNTMLETIGVEDLLPSQVWHTAGLGNCFEKLEYSPGEGVLGMHFCHPLEMRRFWLQKSRKCIGFKWSKESPDKNSLFTSSKEGGGEIERIATGTDKNTEALWYPWDFMHIRRMYRMRDTEHGESIFDEAQGIYKKLRMALDQMVVYRSNIQPDRYVVNIDVQEQVPVEQMRTVQRWKQALRSSLSFGSGDNGNPNDFKSFYNPLALDTVLWMAQPKGFTHTVEKLAGTTQVPDVYDIELLTNLFFSIIGMPRSWIGAGGSGGGGDSGGASPASGKALLAQDMRFLRKIKAIRRPIRNSYTWLGYFHALLKGKNVEDLTIRAKMSDIGSLEDQMRMEVLRSQAETLDALSNVMEKYQLPREAWIELLFKKYMHLPDEVVNIMVTALPEIGPNVGENKKPAPSTAALLQEVSRTLTSAGISDQHILKNIYEAAEGKRTEEDRYPASKWTKAKVLQLPEMKTGDIIQSSYQNANEPLKVTIQDGPSASARKKVAVGNIMESDNASHSAARAFQRFKV